MKTSSNIRAAAEVLVDLAEADNGKQSLPELEPEEPDEYEPDVEEDAEADKSDFTFTDQDAKDFPRLEKQVTGGERQAAEAYREIRQRQLWRLLKDAEGKQVYSNFEAYCKERHGHPRQWVTHLTNWLATTEELERLGIKDPPHLSVRAAQGLLIGSRLKDAGGLRAVLTEAKDDGVPLDRDDLREIVLRRAEYNYRSKEAGSKKPAATSYAEYKADCQTVKQLGDGPTDYEIVAKAKELDGDFADNLVALCQQQRVLPRADNLLAALTGKPLGDVVARLKEVAKESAEIDEKKELLATRRKQIRAMQQEGGLRKLKEEAKALEQELEAKGVLKKKQKGARQKQAGPADSNEGDDDAETNEVCNNLVMALEYLDEALICEWPEDDTCQLNAIVVAAQKCEAKLTEITAKAKELGADVQEPEAVPSGDN